MKIRKELLEEVAFLDLPLFLLGINYVLYNALSMESMKIVFRMVAIILFLIGWILKGNFKIDLKAFIAIILALISLILNGSMALNFTVLVLFAICAEYPIETIIKSAFRINVSLVLLMIILMVSHVVDNTSYISTMGRLRQTLGFENPNVAALFYSSAIYLFLASRRELKKRSVFVAFLLTAVIFLYTNSRTSLVALLIFVGLELLYLIFEKKSMDKAKLIFGKCAVIFIDVLFALNLISVFMINKFMVLDQLLSYRISTFSRMINSAGLRCFLLGGTIKTVDNFYYMLLFQYGIIIYVFVAYSTHAAMKKMIENLNIKYVALLVGLFLVAMMESSLIRPEILVSLVVWKVVLSEQTDYLMEDVGT